MGGGDSFTLVVTDKPSGVLVAEISFTKEQLATALLVQSFEADVVIVSPEHYPNIGRTSEHKTEIVECAWDSSIAEKRKALEPFEVDGWKGSTKNIGNHHHAAGQTSQGVALWRVRFGRYVDAD